MRIVKHDRFSTHGQVNQSPDMVRVVLDMPAREFEAFRATLLPPTNVDRERASLFCELAAIFCRDGGHWLVTHGNKAAYDHIRDFFYATMRARDADAMLALNLCASCPLATKRCPRTGALLTESLRKGFPCEKPKELCSCWRCQGLDA